MQGKREDTILGLIIFFFVGYFCYKIYKNLDDPEKLAQMSKDLGCDKLPRHRYTWTYDFDKRKYDWVYQF